MADISKIILDNTQYNIKDTVARDDIGTLQTSVARLSSDFSDLSDEVSEYSSDVDALDTLVQANTSDISTLQDYDGLVRIPYSASDFNYNFLLWSPSNPTRIYHKRAKFGWTATTRSQYSNIPTKLSSENVAYGVREFFYGDSTNALVKVTEFYPVAGRVHINAYVSSSWSGWQCVDTSTHGVDMSNSYQIVTATNSFVLNANATDTTIDTSISVPSGYTAVGVMGHFFSALPLSGRCRGVYLLNQSTVRTALTHTSTSPVPGTQTLTIYVLCLRTS